MEIYNETIRDLLGNNSDDQKHDIKMTGSADKKDVMVTNLTTVMVTSEDQVSWLNITVAIIIERGKILHVSIKIDYTFVMNDRLGFLYSWTFNILNIMDMYLTVLIYAVKTSAGI